MGPSVVESDDGELQLQARIMAEKNALLKELEEKNYNINRIMQEMGEQVGGEQKDMVDQIEANMSAARDNTVGANEELAAALVEQKKARKKYTCMAVVIIVSLVVAASVIYLFVK
jgi:t-SNARE complex subunit (syntaxin)